MLLSLTQQVYWGRYNKPPLSTRCCHVTDFTGDRRRNRQMNEQTHITIT